MNSITLISIAVFALLTIIVISYSNKTATDLFDLKSQLKLRSLNRFEYVSLVVDRQSGNVEREEQYATVDDALVALQKIYMRAKVDKVRINKSNETEFVTWRAVHNSRGRQEGKRIGGVRLYIERNATAENTFLNEIVNFSTKSEIDEKLMHYVNRGIVEATADSDSDSIKVVNAKFYEKYNKETGEGSWQVSRAEFRYILSMAHSVLVGVVGLDSGNRENIEKLSSLNAQKIAKDMTIDKVLYWQLLSDEDVSALRNRMTELISDYGLEPESYPFIKS